MKNTAPQAGILGKCDISIKSVIQKGRRKGEPVHVVLRVHRSSEAMVEKAIAEIDSLDCCTEPTVRIRVLMEDD